MNLSIKKLKEDAKNGDTKAQYELYEQYMLGIVVTQDERKAVRFLKQSAEGGYAPAQYDMGNLYKPDYGSTTNERVVDYKTAMYWHEKSAHQGHRNAQSSVGCMYRKGQATPKNRALAKQWYEAYTKFRRELTQR